MLASLGALLLTGCGPRTNEWEPVRYALTEEDLGVETREFTVIEPFYGACPAPADLLNWPLDDARVGGGLAESMRAAIDPGQVVQSFAMDLGPGYASATAPEDGAVSDNVTQWVGGDVDAMMERLDCGGREHPRFKVEIAGDLSYDDLDWGVTTGVFGFSAHARGPWSEGSSDVGERAYLPRGDFAFDESLAPEDQQYWLDGRYTVVKGTVIVGVEVVSTHEDRLDADELLQTVVDRLEADTLPTRPPAETRRTD